MRGFILAAGFGTRLRPITDHIPKAMVPVAGKPLLRHAADFLAGAGISVLGANTHYLAEKIAAYSEALPFPLELFHETPEIRGTGGALRFARGFLSGDDSFAIVNADILARFDLAGQCEAFLQSGDHCRLIAWKRAGSGGTVVYDPATMNYRGARGETAHGPGTATADFIGITLYRKEFLQLLTDDDFSILPVWRRAVERGMTVSVAVVDRGYWRDVGTPASLARIHFDIIDNVLPIAPPESLVVDRERRCCFPRRWNGLPEENTGSYCWIEEEALRLPAEATRIVAFPGASCEHTGFLHTTLLTPWGAIPFDE